MKKAPSINENKSEINDWKKLLSFPKPIYILIVGTFINRLGFFVLPYMALYLGKLGYDIKQIGYALASYGLGNVIASIVGGHLADTLGRRKTIVMSMFGCAVMMILLSQTENLWIFMQFAFLAALFSECFRPAAHALIADLVQEEDRVMVYALFRWAVNAGWAIGPAIAGLLTQISYFWIFLGDAVTSAIFGVLALMFIPKYGKSDDVPISHLFDAFGSLKKSLNCTFKDHLFIQVFIASFPISFIFNQCLATLGIEVTGRGFEEVQYGMLLGFNGLIILFTEIPISMWATKQNKRLMMVSGYALIGIGFGLFAFHQGLVILFVGMFVFTVGEMIALPVSLAYMSALAPQDMRGRYMGVWGLSWATSMMVSTSLGIRIHAVMGTWFWISVGFLGIISSVIMSLNPNCFRFSKETKNGTETVH